ncbi:hypothetical protein MRX96_012527 [Rhipicephalus microplus]
MGSFMQRGRPTLARPPHRTATLRLCLARKSGARKVEEHERKKRAPARPQTTEAAGRPVRGRPAGKCPAHTGRPNRWPTLAQLTNGAARQRHDSPPPDAVATLGHALLRRGAPLSSDVAIVTGKLTLTSRSRTYIG